MLKKNTQKFYLFKKLLRLKVIIQKKNLIKKLLNLKKKKWNFFIKSLKYSLNYRKTYKLFDIFKYSLKKKSNGLAKKNNYLNFHNNKQLIKVFYGNLLTRYFNKLLKKYSKDFFNKLESRLDIILYRCFFSSSIALSRKLIKQGFVLVNNKKVTRYSYFIKKGDVISLEKSIQSFLKQKNFLLNIWPICIDNLMINYSTFEIIYNDSLKIKKKFKYYYYYIKLNY